MPLQFSISIDQVVELLGLQRDPRYRTGMASYNVKCPFCDDTKYHMNINSAKNTYNCVHCAGDKTGGGALDLYGRAALGVSLKPGKQKDGGNGNLLYAKLCEALHIGKAPVQPQTKKPQPVPAPALPSRTSDDKLNAAYSAVLGFEHFRLTEAHRQNLLKRGLDDAAIAGNGYCSAVNFDWVSKSAASATYQKFALAEQFNQYESLKRLPTKQRIAGIAVAEHLRQQGIPMEGVPGFFRLPIQKANIPYLWIFRIEAGMLIPTRNMKGQIVGLQARKDHGALRYMTVSSKGLPEGVAEGISRIHYPIGNSELSKNTIVYITEGPLKADVALHLHGKTAYFAAMQGVNNRNELPDLFKQMKERDITSFQNALDMDKFTNPHVIAASKCIEKLARSYGIKMGMLAWDADFAKIKFLELSLLCRQFGIEMRGNYPNEHFAVRELATSLTRRGIRHSIYIGADGEEEKRYWKDETKGIDDFLLSQQSKG